MKIKTSITLSDDLLMTVDARAEQAGQNRSEFIEMALRAYLHQLERAEQHAADLMRIAAHAEALNRSVMAALGRREGT
ncbi:MAG: ribbon-helix-helix domain-containing protein [Anaerolineae bacterium]|nr:ribbon-helix-helix domain-containing protein [Caldilineales bacterium]MCX7851364.1 ribbon-helix-helix domain-containing protein [Caldilineales bacterium]MDW8268429.1 ribbon-helix-helix domain-containing protein [Anaerolineae bacterium]